MWLYADQVTMAWYEAASKKLTYDPFFSNYLEQFRAGDYNIGFVAKPEAAASLPLPQLGEQLQYTSLMTRFEAEYIGGSLLLQFSDGVISRPESPFFPKFTDFVRNENIVYLEMQQLLSFFGVEKENFVQIAPFFLGKQDATLQALFTDEMYSQIYEGLQGNVGILLEKADNAFGLSLHLVFADPAMYDVLHRLSPLLKTSLLGFTAGGEIQEQKVGSGVRYSTQG